MKLSDRIRYVREAGHIDRCHQWPRLRPYQNGQHTWGVCVILRMLWPERRDLLDFALFHDTPERDTGDIPSPAIKRLGIADLLAARDAEVMQHLRLPLEHALEEDGWHILRAADSLDLWLWTYDEEALGNRAAVAMRAEIDAGFSRKLAAGLLPREAWEFIEEFRAEGWKRMGDIE